MTSTSPSRLRAHLRRLAPAAVAALLTAGMLTPTAAAAVDEEVFWGVTLLLAPAQGGVVAEGGTAHLEVTLHNDGSSPASAGTLNVEIGDTPLRDQAQLAAWLNASGYEGSFLPLATSPTEELPGRLGQELDLFATPTGEPGVYPLRAGVTGVTSLRGDTTIHHTPVAHSVLIVGEAERSVTLIVPITLTPQDGTLLSAAELAEATDAEGVLATALDALGGTSAVLAVDPAIPAAIRALGTAAPASAAAWLTRLEALPNERIALQFGDTDVTAQAQAGLSEPLAAPPLASVVDPQNFEEGAALPSLAELTGIRGAAGDVLWPRGALREDDLVAFSEYFGAGTTTILPSTSVVTAETSTATVSGHAVLVHDASASGAWALAIAEPDAGLRQHLVAAAVAQLSLSPARGAMLLALPRDEARASEGLAEAVAALERLGTPLSLAELRAQTPRPVELLPRTDAERADAVSLLQDDERRLTAFSSILDEPAILTDIARMRLLRTLAVGDHPEGFTTALADHRERTAWMLSAVGVQPSSDVHVLSASVDLPVWVRNDLPWPITVTLNARSADARLEVQRTTEIPVMPQTNERVRVPVQARIASGEVDVRLGLTSATGVPVGETTVTHVKVRAEWESIGLRVLGGIVALLLVLGVIRTLRRKRREPDAASAEQGGASE